jgi:hypothetical protein
MEYQVTIPTTSGQESLDISFSPVEKVLLYLSPAGFLTSKLKQKINQFRNLSMRIFAFNMTSFSRRNA